LSTVETAIAELEERLRLAELGPDPKFFDEALDENVVLIAEDGQLVSKSKVVDAHRPGKAPKFTRVEMSDMKIIDHGTAAVVTCRGTNEAPQSSVTLKFMRLWIKKNNGWKIVAGSISH
jgi:hypothetical protein